MALHSISRIGLLIFGAPTAKRTIQPAKWSQLFTDMNQGQKCRSQNVLIVAPAVIEPHMSPAAASAPLPDVSGMQLVLVPPRFQGTATLVCYSLPSRKKVVVFFHDAAKTGSLRELDAVLGFVAPPFACTEWFLSPRRRADHGVVSLVTAAVMDPKVVEKWSQTEPLLDFDNYDKPTQIKARYSLISTQRAHVKASLRVASSSAAAVSSAVKTQANYKKGMVIETWRKWASLTAHSIKAVGSDWVQCTACRLLHDEENPTQACEATTVEQYRSLSKIFFDLLQNGHSALNKHLKCPRHEEALRAWKGTTTWPDALAHVRKQKIEVALLPNPVTQSLRQK